MENSSSEAYQIGQSIGEALGSAVIFFWIILIVIGAMFLALLVWFIWIMTRIKQENVKTNKLLAMGTQSHIVALLLHSYYMPKAVKSQ